MKPQQLRQLLIAALIAVLLGGVFAAYLRPEFVFDLANRLVFCQ